MRGSLQPSRRWVNVPQSKPKVPPQAHSEMPQVELSSEPSERLMQIQLMRRRGFITKKQARLLLSAPNAGR
jgi:hypothetical protein